MNKGDYPMDPSANPAARQESIEKISKLFKTISDPTRLSILFLLRKEDYSVGAIAQALNMEHSAISHQLKSLKNQRLIKSKRDGKKMIYSLDDHHVFHILDQVLTHIEEEG